MCTNNKQSSDSRSYFKTNSNATYYTTIKFLGFIWGWFSEISYFFILTVNVSHLPHMTLMSTSSALHVHSLSCPAHQLCKLLHVLIFSLFFHSCFCYGGGVKLASLNSNFWPQDSVKMVIFIVALKSRNNPWKMLVPPKSPKDDTFFDKAVFQHHLGHPKNSSPSLKNWCILDLCTRNVQMCYTMATEANLELKLRLPTTSLYTTRKIVWMLLNTRAISV